MERASNLLIAELLGPRRKHADLYLTNVWFKRALDTFATFLPAFVDGVAARANEEQEKHDERLERVMSSMWPWNLLS